MKKNGRNRYISKGIIIIFSMLLALSCLACAPKDEETSVIPAGPEGTVTTPVEEGITEAESAMGINKEAFAPGEDILVTFATTSSFSDTAFIGILPYDTPHDVMPTMEKADGQPIGGKSSGELKFAAPEVSGDYELRLYDKGVEVFAVAFTITE